MPAFNAANFYSGTGGTASGAHSAAGSDRYVFVLAGCPSGITGVTYNSVSMTLIDGTVSNERLYGLVNPPTGSVTVTASSGASDSVGFVVASYTGVDQTTPYDGLTAAILSGTTPSRTVTSRTGDMVVGGNAAANFGAITSTAGAGQTEREDGFEGNLFSVTWSDEAGASSVTHSYTLASSPGFDSHIFALNLRDVASATLTVDTQPSTATSGVAMSNVIIDSSDTGSTATVTAAIQTGGGVLSGTTSAAMTAGTVTFSNLIITGSGAHTLRFTASGHSSVDSTTITVSGASLAFRPYYITG